MLVVDAVWQERYWYPEEGGEVWVAGYQLVEPQSGRYLGRDAPELAARGLRISAVAGAGMHHAPALGSEEAAPGSSLVLRRDPGNPHDPNAIAVLGAGADAEQLGWVPRELAAELASSLDAGDPWSALILREQRRSPRDGRHGLTMLLAPTAGLELRDVPDR